MIPVSALRFLPVIDVTVDDYTVVKADGRFLFEKALHGRPQKASNVFDGAFATLLSGKQPGNPEGKPALLGKADFNGNFIPHDLLDAFSGIGGTQQRRNHPVTADQPFRKDCIAESHFVCFLLPTDCVCVHRLSSFGVELGQNAQCSAGGFHKDGIFFGHIAFLLTGIKSDFGRLTFGLIDCCEKARRIRENQFIRKFHIRDNDNVFRILLRLKKPD